MESPITEYTRLTHEATRLFLTRGHYQPDDAYYKTLTAKLETLDEKLGELWTQLQKETK